MAFPSISLCMIVKNEQDWIGQAINSVQSVVSQTVVVDTGSTDRTVEIASSLGAEIYEFPWQDDFALARNFSLEKAKGDWILVLDADEAIAESQLQKLQELTKIHNNCYLLTQRHYCNDHRISSFMPVRKEFPQWEFDHKGYFESSLVRLFPNRVGISYVGKVHELVEPKIAELPELKVVPSNIILHHYGHTAQIKRQRSKGALYTPLGEAKTEDQPENWKAFYELGIEHNLNGQPLESIKSLKKAAQLKPDYTATWVNLGYVQCELGQYQEAVESLSNAIKISPESPEAYCNLGVVFLRVGQYAKSEQILTQAIKLKPNYVNAYCNLAKALSYQKRLSEAVNVLRRALEILPDCPEALSDLGAIYLMAGMYQKAEHYLGAALQHNQASTNLLYNLAQLYKQTNRIDKAIDSFEQLRQQHEKNFGTSRTPQQTALIDRIKAESAALKAQVAATPTGGRDDRKRI